MANKNFMQIVKTMCETTSTDCRSLNKAELARELMDMVNIPSTATIEEIPLDWNNQVGICFTMPNDNNYYSLYAGHWNNGTEKMMLCIIGTQVHSGSKSFFEFLTEEKEVSLDYFIKNQNEKQNVDAETETTNFYVTYEEPLHGRCFTEKQMHEVYRDMTNKTEYPTFDIWFSDMIKSGVFERVTITIQAQILQECKETFESLAYPVNIETELDNVKGCKMCDLEDTINVHKYYTK